MIDSLIIYSFTTTNQRIAAMYKKLKELAPGTRFITKQDVDAGVNSTSLPYLYEKRGVEKDGIVGSDSKGMETLFPGDVQVLEVQ